MRKRMTAAILGVLIVAAFGCAEDEEAASRPDVVITADPTSGVAPLTVEFVVDADNTGPNRKWEFGDGEESSEFAPRHTYAQEGTYEVKVWVADDRENLLIRTVEIEVLPPDPGDALMPGVGDWVEQVNAACSESVEAVAELEQSTSDPTSPEALAALGDITRAETETIEAIGVPTEQTAAVENWLELRSAGEALFISMTENPPVAQADPRVATLDTLAEQLEIASTDLGLTDCVG